jgi:hypothetical protein
MADKGVLCVRVTAKGRAECNNPNAPKFIVEMLEMVMDLGDQGEYVDDVTGVNTVGHDCYDNYGPVGVYRLVQLAQYLAPGRGMAAVDGMVAQGLLEWAR